MNAVLKPLIGEEERAKRKANIDYARGTCRLEGIILSADIEHLNQLYIDGHMTSQEHTTRCFEVMERECSTPA